MRGAKASFFMRYRKLSSDGDYVFGAGKNDFLVNSPEAVAQAILTRLKLWLGEWFADTTDGTGWSQSIIGKHSKNLYELTLRQRVLETQGVVNIIGFQSSLTVSLYRPDIINIGFKLNIVGSSEYTKEIENDIKQNLADYVNQLDIGDRIMMNKLWIPAGLFGNLDSETYQIDSIQIIANNMPIAGDCNLAFNAVAYCDIDNIEINTSGGF